MITLCGSSISNYYNKVKLVLLEKNVPFEERLVRPGSGEPACSPLGKIPYVETPDGPMCESAAIVEWLDAAHPQPALMPADAWKAAKVRELSAYLEVHMELAVRQLYPQAFFRTPLPERYVERVRPDIERAIAGVARLARFAPHAAGEAFTLADCAAFVHLPLAAMATRLVYGNDLVAAAGIDWKSYVQRIEQRPSAARVSADRKKAQAAMAAGA